MAIDFHIKQNDTSPALKTQLLDENGNAIDLSASGVNVDFHLRKEDATTKKFKHAATITDAVNGKVEYDWEPGDTDTAGIFEGEFQVTYSNGDIETFPNDGYIRIGIDSEVA